MASTHEFVNKPSVYLETDESRTNYKLYVTMQLGAGETAHADEEREGHILTGVLYNVSASPDAPSEPWILQQTLEFVVEEGVVLEDPMVVVAVTVSDGSKNTVIVHHADADVPGDGIHT